MKCLRWWPALLVMTFAVVVSAERKVEITLSDKVASEPVTGRIFLFVSSRAREPIRGPNWFRPEPFFGMNVAGIKPGQAVELTPGKTDAFPKPLAELDGSYRVQAVLHHSIYSASPSGGDGNFKSQVIEVEFGPDETAPIQLTLDQVIRSRKVEESETVKFVRIRSKLQSEFHKREVFEEAVVVLPPSYQEGERRYGVIYEISGFGGTLPSMASRALRRGGPGEGEEEFIRVLLSGQCSWGHHVYANSATNGPRGDSFVKELVPHIDRKFRTIGKPTARFLTGHSSGGWSSLWLQVAYPDDFNGVWSSAPDPIDFRDFQQINIYKDKNFYKDASGGRRPLARSGERVMIYFDVFTPMDDCLDRGGQLRSFEAVFSPRGSDGLPLRLWNRKTGAIDPAVAKAWEKYDINLLLQRNWKTLGPKLKDKLHIVTGELDTFYLEGAVELTSETLKRLGSNAQVEVVPGKNHSNVRTAARRAADRLQMSQRLRKFHPPTSGE